MRTPTLLCLSLLAGCVHTDDAEPTLELEAKAPVLANNTNTEPAPTTQDVALPENWQGTGVLARATYDVPSGAPEWAQTSAEIVEKDGQRHLLTVGRATGIKSEHLARTTAEARARVEITRWTKNQTIIGSTVAETFRDPSTGVVFARVSLVVPATWIPGQPLAN